MRLVSGGTFVTVYTVSTSAEFKSALLAWGAPRVVRLADSADLDGGGEYVKIKHGNLTIDGAPVRRYSIVIAASSVIVTQLRLRPGTRLIVSPTVKWHSEPRQRVRMRIILCRNCLRWWYHARCSY